jgi:predicted DNA-binding transcriptional regulator YafY
LEDGGRAGPEPKIVLLLRLLGAIEAGTYGFEDLKGRVSPERPPSTRSLRRYLATLAQAGFGWTYDRTTGTYRFPDGGGLRRLHLSEPELQGLAAVRALAGSLGGNLSASIEAAVAKVVAVADRPVARTAAKPAVRIHMSDLELDSERAKAFELLQRAQRLSRTVQFTYVDKRSRRTERTVDPYGFVVSGGRAYVVAHDHARNAKRVFALDRISAQRLGVRRFEPPADFDIEAFAARSISGIMHSDAPAAVTVRFSAVVSGAARAERIVRDRTIVELPDGAIEVTYGVDDLDELVRWTLRWGTEAEIVAPPEARAGAGALAAALAECYAGDGGTKRRRPPKIRRPQ